MKRWIIGTLMAVLTVGYLAQAGTTASSAPHADAFMDVASSYPFYQYIESLAARKVIDGSLCGGPNEPCDGSEREYFRPTTSLLRKDMARFVAKAKAYDDTPTQQIFMDVPPSHPDYIYIERIAMHDLIVGYVCGGANEPCDGSGRNYFRPNEEASRQALAKVVSIAAGYTDTPMTQTFKDVPSSHALYVYIERLGSRGIASGVPCGSLPEEPCDAQNRPYFRPEATIPRGPSTKWLSILDDQAKIYIPFVKKQADR